MSDFSRILVLPPNSPGAPRPPDCTVAHLSYRMGPGPRLFRAGGPQAPGGGLLALAEGECDGEGNSAAFCQEVLRECAGRGFRGVLCDFDRPPSPSIEALLRQLARELARRQWPLYLPEAYHACAPEAKLLISSALSGGCLDARLEEAVQRHGSSRLLLALEPVAEDFLLPSPNGCGRTIPFSQVERLRAEKDATVFFSSELCARYFTYLCRETGAHFVLFDDGATLRRKLELARRLGFAGAVLPWPQIAPWAQELDLFSK